MAVGLLEWLSGSRLTALRATSRSLLTVGLSLRPHLSLLVLLPRHLRVGIASPHWAARPASVPFLVEVLDCVFMGLHPHFVRKVFQSYILLIGFLGFSSCVRVAPFEVLSLLVVRSEERRHLFSPLGFLLVDCLRPEDRHVVVFRLFECSHWGWFLLTAGDLSYLSYLSLEIVNSVYQLKN